MTCPHNSSDCLLAYELKCYGVASCKYTAELEKRLEELKQTLSNLRDLAIYQAGVIKKYEEEKKL